MDYIHYNYWTLLDRENLCRARTFIDLADLALSIISRLPVGVEMVSGPISTGGVGTICGNRKVFEGIIEILIKESGLNIFSQMPFEDKMVEFYKVWHAKHPTEKYCMPILYEFYDRVFSTGKVKGLHFIHGWESSYGAKWEHDYCVRWSIDCHYLTSELSQKVLSL
jgi:hypothetical protein